ncbi:MAG: hypothetical protein VB081_06725 [Christensenella sp.]|uniref:hypothetical protein n=1 Tax=Christensenella sp. TaxID=1935934 RepID=UPI002B1ECACE|nr:hypothetical protein [Christensenella sp.]MEA5003177.1 hypothetical protein [Christensenella sp.]
MAICIPSLRAALAKTSEANTASRLRIGGIVLFAARGLDDGRNTCWLCSSK